MTTNQQGMSILIPCHNEQGNIELLIQEIEQECRLNPTINVEVIWIDDASVDSGFSMKAMFPENHKIIKNYRKLGQSLSISRGFNMAKYDLIGILDGDTQNVPTDLFDFCKIMREFPEVDMIQGRRLVRNDKLVRRFPSRIANGLIRMISKAPFNDLGCGTKILRRDLCRKIPFRGEIHRIYALHAYMGGYNVLEKNVKHRPRKFGKSKYGLKRLFKLIVDILFLRFKFAITEKPIYVFGGISLGMLIISFLMFFAAIILRITNIKDYLDGALVIGSIILLITAILTIFISFVLEIILQKISVITNELKN